MLYCVVQYYVQRLGQARPGKRYNASSLSGLQYLAPNLQIRLLLKYLFPSQSKNLKFLSSDLIFDKIRLTINYELNCTGLEMLETFSQLKIAVRYIMMMMLVRVMLSYIACSAMAKWCPGTRGSLMYHILFTPILPEQALLTDERTDKLL